MVRSFVAPENPFFQLRGITGTATGGSANESQILPTVSVILTSYNCAPFLDQAVGSIVDQTWRDWELLISDDGSTDGSQDKLRDWAARDPRIGLFVQPHNLGLVRNYNFLFGQATGDLVAIQDADDWSDPTRLARQVAMLADPAFVLCGTSGAFHLPSGQTQPAAADRSRVIDHAFDDFPSLPASVMFRRSMLDLYSGWPEHFAGGTSMDRYFLMDLLDGRTGFHIGEPLYHANIRASSSHRSWSERKMVTHHLFLALQRQRRDTGTDALREGDVAALRALEDGFSRDPKLISQSLRESAVIKVDCGQYAAARALLARALRLDPLSLTNWRTAFYLARRMVRTQRRTR